MRYERDIIDITLDYIKMWQDNLSVKDQKIRLETFEGKVINTGEDTFRVEYKILNVYY